MKNIIVFAGSNSRQSINRQLAVYASKQLDDMAITVLDLNDFNLPMYSIDVENENGIPEDAVAFLHHIKSSDGIICALAEHNGLYSSVFKNLIDWMSRIEGKLFYDKPMLLMATSPGGRGGLSVLELAKERFPRHGAQIVASFSLPSFYDNFKEGKIQEQTLDAKLQAQVLLFSQSL